MKIQDLLHQARQLLDLALKFDQPTDVVLSQHFRGHRDLGSHDRAVLTATVYNILRKKPLFEHLAATHERSVLLRRLVLLGWKGDAEKLKPALKPDEVEWFEQAQQVDPQTLPEVLRHNLPDWLVEPLKTQLGEEFWLFVESINQPAPLDLRVNVLKLKRDQVLKQLEQKGFASTATPYSPWGIRLEGKPALYKDPLYVNGEIEVQDEGSQLLALLVEPKRGSNVIDFCAGAGGKTLALGAAMRNTGRLYAWDISAKRLDALQPRLTRSGLSNVHTMAMAHENDARIKRLYGKADRVLVDAPCSGLGTLRRSPELKWRQTPETVQAFTEQQFSILESASRLLKSKGRLVYATCSLLPQENEEIAQRFNDLHKDFKPVPVRDILEGQGVAASHLVQGDYLRLWPQRHQTDGFFAAVWEKV